MDVENNPGVQGLAQLWRNAIERIAELERENASLLRLVSDIRVALGDNGKRMQPELVEYCKELRKNAERWRFAKLLFVSNGLRMDGTQTFHVPFDQLPRARSIDAAIDAARAAQKMNHEARSKRRKENGNG